MNLKPTPEVMHAIELCVSDRNKGLLLKHPGFIEYLQQGLAPREDLTIGLQQFNQCMHAECE